LRQLNRILEISEASGEVRWCYWRRRWVWRWLYRTVGQRSLDILSVKKEARLSARALAEVEVGRGAGGIMV